MHGRLGGGREVPTTRGVLMGIRGWVRRCASGCVGGGICGKRWVNGWDRR